MYRILVADDEPIERQVINKKIAGFFPGQVEIYMAENGLEAVKTFEDNSCQIAILDIEMPGMNGLEAAEEIRKKDKNCSIIFLTAFDEFSYAKKAIGVRALDYLLKPGADEDLINVLEEAFDICDKETTIPASVNSFNDKDIEHYKVYGSGNMSNKLISDITTFIDEHYSEDIALQDIASVLGYSDVYFCKLFKQNFGKNFITYLNEYRMAKAKELLSNPLINIKDVGQKAGYRDANYFTRVFKRMVGMTPSEYRIGVLGS